VEAGLMKQLVVKLKLDWWKKSLLCSKNVKSWRN